MADYRSIATVATAVLRHLQDFGTRVQQPEPILLCQPAELATSQGIAICLWRVVAAPKHNQPMSIDRSGLRMPSPPAFDLHFLGTSIAQDVVRQCEGLGWLLCALTSKPVLKAGNSSLDTDQRPRSMDEEGVSLSIHQPDEIAELNVRAAFGLSAPTVHFIARSAFIAASDISSVRPVLTRPNL
jgi:hypothetical protein